MTASHTAQLEITLSDITENVSDILVRKMKDLIELES